MDGWMGDGKRIDKRDGRVRNKDGGKMAWLDGWSEGGAAVGGGRVDKHNVRLAQLIGFTVVQCASIRSSAFFYG